MAGRTYANGSKPYSMKDKYTLGLAAVDRGMSKLLTGQVANTGAQKAARNVHKKNTARGKK